VEAGIQKKVVPPGLRRKANVNTPVSRLSLTLTFSTGRGIDYFYHHFPRVYALGYTHAAPGALKCGTANR